MNGVTHHQRRLRRIPVVVLIVQHPGVAVLRDDAGVGQIGRRLPGLFREAGLAVTEVRLMSKLARPADLSWHWPGSFYDSYMPRLIAAGVLDPETLDAALEEWEELARIPGACCRCPQMVEVIAEKPSLG